MLETLVRFKAKNGLTEFRRTITITGKNMKDINDQAASVVKYLIEQTDAQWFYEFLEERDLEK
jgi:hypothetical protein